MSESTIPLADVIQQLRGELQTAMQAGKNEDLRFGVEELELELQLLVTQGGSVKGGAKGGVKFWVLNAETSGEASAKYETSRVQKITLKLKPKTKTDEPVDVAAYEDVHFSPGR